MSGISRAAWLGSALVIAVCAASAWAGPAEGPATAFPGKRWTTAERPEWDDAHLQSLFAYTREQRSSALLLVHRGELIAEHYWTPPDSARYQRMLTETLPDGRSLEDVASVQKSIVSFLVGMAEARGLLSLAQPVSDFLGPGWSEAASAAEDAVSIRHLLTMTSGLTPGLTAEAAPGERWRYNTRAYSKLVSVLEAASGDDINTLTRNWLTGPLKMSESEWRPRAWLGSDTDANTQGFVTSARDLARFGLLMLEEGRWQHGPILGNDTYQRTAISPSQTLNPAYGYLWWLNGQPALSPQGDRTPSLIPAAPGDLFAAQGALGRKLYVVPSLELVVVRLGDQPEADFNQQFWLRLMTAIGAAPICQRCGDPLADRPSSARSAEGTHISWREHIIDDPTRGVPDLSGSDGLAMADLDGDGFEDIVSVHESDTVYDGKPIGHVRIAWGSADPDQWSLTTLASGADAAAAEDVSIADANGDGHPDVLVACELAHLIYFQNPGRNPRTTRWQSTIPPVTRNRGSWIRAFFADFDGDGRPEVSAANKGAQNPGDIADPEKTPFSLFHLPPDPLDGDGWEEQILGRAQVPINAEPVDLDGDGDLDVVAGSRRERRVLWFENRGDFLFLEHVIQVPGAPEELSITGFNMDYADLTGDGRTDIVSTAWPGVLVLLTQPETAAAPWGFESIGDAGPDQLVSVRLTDLDGDGDLDIFSGAYSRGPRDRDGPLVTVNDPMGRILWFENRPDGWVAHQISRRKRGMYDNWLFRDLDGDGDPDALGTRGNSEPYDGVLWLEQVRSPRPTQNFSGARRLDSQQMGPPET